MFDDLLNVIIKVWRDTSNVMELERKRSNPQKIKFCFIH